MENKIGYAFFSSSFSMMYLRIYKIRTTGEKPFKNSTILRKQQQVPCEIIEQIFNYCDASNTTADLYTPGVKINVGEQDIAYSSEQYDKLYNLHHTPLMNSIRSELTRISDRKEFILQKLKENEEIFASTEDSKKVIESLSKPKVNF